MQGVQKDSSLLYASVLQKDLLYVARNNFFQHWRRALQQVKMMDMHVLASATLKR